MNMKSKIGQQIKLGPQILATNFNIIISPKGPKPEKNRDI